MGVLRGANLVGMSLLPLDVVPRSWLSKKKKKTFIIRELEKDNRL